MVENYDDDDGRERELPGFLQQHQLKMEKAF